MFYRLKIKTLLLLFFLLGFFVILPRFHAANAQASCFNPVQIEVEPVRGLPSPGDFFTATVTLDNWCGIPVGSGYRTGVLWDVDGNTSFFSEWSFGMDLVSNIAPGESFTFKHTTMIKDGNTCLIRGNVRARGFIEDPKSDLDDASGVAEGSTSGAGIGSTLNVYVNKPDGSPAFGATITARGDDGYFSSVTGASAQFQRMNCNVNHAITASLNIGGADCTASKSDCREATGCLCNGQVRSLPLTLSCPPPPTPTTLTPTPSPPSGCGGAPCAGFVETAPGAWGYCCTSSWCDSGGAQPSACASDVYECVGGSWQYRWPQCGLNQGSVITYPCTGCSAGVTPPPPPSPPPSDCPSGMQKCVDWWECPAGYFCDSSYSGGGSWGCCEVKSLPPGGGSTPRYLVWHQVRNVTKGEAWVYGRDFPQENVHFPGGSPPADWPQDPREREKLYGFSNIETNADPEDELEFRITVKNMDSKQMFFQMFTPFRNEPRWENPTAFGNILDNTYWPGKICDPENAYACDWWGCCDLGPGNFLGYAGRGSLEWYGTTEAQQFKVKVQGGAQTFIGQAYVSDSCWCPGGNPACGAGTCDCTVGCSAPDAIQYPSGTCGWFSWQCEIRPYSAIAKVNIGPPVTCQVALSPSSLTVPLGMSGNLSANVTVSDSSVGVQKVDFTIDRPEVANFNPATDWSSPYSTKITSLAPSGGTPANILGTATLANGATCQSPPTTLTVPTPTCSLSPWPSTLNLIEDDTALLSTNVLLPAGGSVNRVTFASQNSGVATVAPSFDNDGSDGYKTTVTGGEQGETDLTLTAYLDPGNFAGCNATVPVTVKPPPPWFQVFGGDVHAQGDVSTRIPISATPPYFSLELDGYPGVISAKGLAQFTPGSVSEKGWRVEGEHYDQYSVVNRYDYEYFKRIANPESKNPGEIDPSLPNGIYKVAGNLTIGGWTIGSDKKLVIFVEGDLTITDQIKVEALGVRNNTIVFIVKGDINIGPGVSVPGASPEPVIEGIYLTNGTISTGASPTRLVARGVFVAYGGFNLERTPVDTSQPAEKFLYDPNLVMQTPPGLMESAFIWQEIAP